mmetsp:Transcript_55791/g.121939  ORF Transcript_55791/g.121939 Transcript_55791/m.121939 type:complete len:100 (+) Transcript_55791:615-914(+)
MSLGRGGTLCPPPALVGSETECDSTGGWSWNEGFVLSISRLLLARSLNYAASISKFVWVYVYAQDYDQKRETTWAKLCYTEGVEGKGRERANSNSSRNT